MPTPKKEKTIEELTELVTSAKSVILTDFRGLTMKDVTALRARLRPEQVVFRVVKNTLLRRAAQGQPLSELAEKTEGPTAAVFGLQDSVAPARLLTTFIRESRSPLQIKSGVIDGQCYDAAAVSQIAKLPGREVLLSMVVGGLQGPMANLAGTMQTMVGSLVWALQAVADQKQA